MRVTLATGETSSYTSPFSAIRRCMTRVRYSRSASSLWMADRAERTCLGKSGFCAARAGDQCSHDSELCITSKASVGLRSMSSRIFCCFWFCTELLLGATICDLVNLEDENNYFPERPRVQIFSNSDLIMPTIATGWLVDFGCEKARTFGICDARLRK